MHGIIQKKNHSNGPAHDAIFRYAESLGFGELHIKIDHATQLKAIIAVHSTKLGPAIGGARLIHYETTDAAIEDALRLAQMMSYKAAISNLAHGGAKAVLIKPKVIHDRQAYFEVFGNFINDLHGKYVTAVDSGTESADMDIIARRTKYVTCTTERYAGDPSPITALGVRRGIEAAVQFKLGRSSLAGVHVAIQGAGHVGYHVAKEVLNLGARVTITDINPETLQRAAKELDVATVAPSQIYDLPCDVFAPCALGGILNLDTIQRLQAPIVAGSANSQLAHHHHGYLLHQRNILYAPDFVVNSGGLIHVAAIYDHADEKTAYAKINDIYNTLINIFTRAEDEKRPTSDVAEAMALEKLK